MTSIPTKKEKSIQYSSAIVRRAERALCCSPFKLDLLAAMADRSVPLLVIASQSGIEQNYTRRLLSERSVENSLMWLIQVGLLRREVDGQGITDSFRLTPLGRQLVEKWQIQSGSLPTPSWWDRLLNTLNCWLRLPI